jgi:predicted dehydrogenase
MLRIGIIGCGKIADQHVHAIRRVSDCQIVALCDRELLMAQQLGERFQIPAVFSDVSNMLESVQLDVIHITTPPQQHYSIAQQCLEAGNHVYLEKPFTVTAKEAESLVDVAQRCGRKITVGHNYQFTLEMLEMRRLVSEGFLGERPIHLESSSTYDLGDASYVGPILGNRNHWARQLPGQLLQNVISHGIARLVEFLDDEIAYIIARADQSPQLRALGGREVLDELRVLIRDRKGTTAAFCFSTQIKPGRNQFQIWGSRNSLTVNQSYGTLIVHRNRSHKSYLTYFVPPLSYAAAELRNAWRNVTSFLTRRLYQDFGMKELIERFYRSVRLDEALPIPYREITLTARIMDEIFLQIYGRKPTCKARDEMPVLR